MLLIPWLMPPASFANLSNYSRVGIVKLYNLDRARFDARLWIEKTNVLVDNGTDISGFRESPGATEIGNAVRKKSPAGIGTAIRVFETQPRRERDRDRDRDPKLPPSPP